MEMIGYKMSYKIKRKTLQKTKALRRSLEREFARAFIEAARSTFIFDSQNVRNVIIDSHSQNVRQSEKVNWKKEGF